MVESESKNLIDVLDEMKKDSSSNVLDYNILNDKILVHHSLTDKSGGIFYNESLRMRQNGVFSGSEVGELIDSCDALINLIEFISEQELIELKNQINPNTPQIDKLSIEIRHQDLCDVLARMISVFEEYNSI